MKLFINEIVLTKDIFEKRLKKGDVATIVIYCCFNVDISTKN